VGGRSYVGIFFSNIVLESTDFTHGENSKNFLQNGFLEKFAPTEGRFRKNFFTFLQRFMG
jgi:hypothetical protein